MNLRPDRKRYFPQDTKAWEELLRAWAPPGATIVTDMANGALRLSYPPDKTRSVSWTLRGDKLAAMTSLTILWDWHFRATGNAFPINAGNINEFFS